MVFSRYEAKDVLDGKLVGHAETHISMTKTKDVPEYVHTRMGGVCLCCSDCPCSCGYAPSAPENKLNPVDIHLTLTIKLKPISGSIISTLDPTSVSSLPAYADLFPPTQTNATVLV